MEPTQEAIAAALADPAKAAELARSSTVPNVCVDLLGAIFLRALVEREPFESAVEVAKIYVADVRKRI